MLVIFIRLKAFMQRIRIVLCLVPSHIFQSSNVFHSSFDPRQNTIQCYSPLKAAAGSRLALSDNLSILGPELSLPSQPQVQVSSYQVALNILGCLDVLSMSLEKGLTVEDTLTRKEETTPDSKVEDFSFVNRFEGEYIFYFYGYQVDLFYPNWASVNYYSVKLLTPWFLDLSKYFCVWVSSYL